jgi:hypothetical protein
MQLIVPVNYLAIFVCGVISVGLGVVWHSPIILGKTWLEEIERSDDELKKDFNPFRTHGLSFIGNLFIAYSLAQLLANCGVNTIIEGIRISFLCWIGFVLAPMFTNSLFQGRFTWMILVDSGYHLMVLLVFGVVLGAWTI